MELSELTMILTKLGVDLSLMKGSHRRKNQLLIPCPLAPYTHKSKTDNNPSCSIKFGDPASPTVFNCHSCKERGKFWNLVHSVGSLSGDDTLVQLAFRLLETDEPSLSTRLASIGQSFDEWVYSPEQTDKIIELDHSVLSRYPQAWDVPESQKYLLGRKGEIDYLRAMKWNLRFDTYQRRVMFPVETAKGKLVGAVGRTIIPDFNPRYFNYFGFEASKTLGGLHALTGQKKIAVLEGFFCLVRSWHWFQELGYDACCTWKADCSPEQANLLLGLDTTIHFFYDLDEAGDRGWEKAKETLEKVTFGLRRAVWQNKNLDIGDMDKIQLRHAIASVAHL